MTQNVLKIKKYTDEGFRESIFNPFAAAHPDLGHRGKRFKQKGPDLPLLGHLLQLSTRDVITPAISGSSPGPLPGRTWLKQTGGIPCQISEPGESGALLLVAKGEPRPHLKEACICLFVSVISLFWSLSRVLDQVKVGM